MGNSVVTDVQFGHLFLVCIKYDALQEVTCGLFRKMSHHQQRDCKRLSMCVMHMVVIMILYLIAQNHK